MVSTAAVVTFQCVSIQVQCVVLVNKACVFVQVMNLWRLKEKRCVQCVGVLA